MAVFECFGLDSSNLIIDFRDLWKSIDSAGTVPAKYPKMSYCGDNK